MSSRVEEESVWLSALYALIEGASESLEISRDDIDGALAWSKTSGAAWCCLTLCRGALALRSGSQRTSDQC